MVSVRTALTIPQFDDRTHQIMSPNPVTNIVLLSPEVVGQTVQFSWTVSPSTELFAKTGFYLTFPASVPLGEVPMRLWWTVFLMCIHSHWALLRPCVIHLPVRLAPAEIEVWTRLVMSYADTLDALNPKRAVPGNIRIVTQGESLGNVVPLANKELCATAFSGGKDSLVQAGLLMEMGFKPILVTTTSPMAGDYLHSSIFRAKAMEELQTRCGLNLVEVHSDLRGNWDNGAPRRWGYKVAMNEMTDTLLYTAALLVTGYVCGVTRLFLASENEVSRNHVMDGVYLQHRHYMYSALTQAAISTLLEPFGMKYGSLTSALHSNQIQELLIRRYAHLSDLQCSCWLSDNSVKACSVCSECKRLAWVALAAGGSPAKLGVNLMQMLHSYANFVPDKKAAKSRRHPPNQLVSDSLKNQVANAILSISPGMVRSYISSNHPEALSDGTAEQATQQFIRIQAETRAEFPDPPPKSRYRPGYLNILDDVIKEKLVHIFDDQFQSEDIQIYEEQLANLNAAIDWVCHGRRQANREEVSPDA